MSDIEARIAVLRARFLASAPCQAILLRDALQSGDRDRAMHVAHQLAGASGIFGQPVLGEHAEQLELAIESGTDALLVERLFAKVVAEITRLNQADCN